MIVVGRLVVAALVGAGSLLLTAGAVGREGGVLSGFVIGHLPEGIGERVSDYRTEWGGVAFDSRVWERGLPGGGYRVDLKVNVLRGDRLADLPALRDFLIEYHERDPAAWRLEEFRHGSHAGYRTADQAFWLVEPGLGVSLRLASDRFGPDELLATALGVRRAGA